jgi:hypothetical protein
VFLLAAFVIQVQAGVFAPPLGVPIHIVTERTQGDGPSRFTVRVERTVRFTRDGIGYRAEIVLVKADSGDRTDMAAMLQAGFTGLAGRPMTFRLDAAGKVVAIDDQQAIWDRFCNSVIGIVAARHKGTPAERTALAERMAAPLRALPPERQQATLGSLVSALVATHVTDPPGIRPIRIPGSSPYGGTVELTGVRTITSAGPLIHTATRAATDVPQADGPGARLELENDEDSDPRTGLVSAHSDTLRTTMGTGPEARVTERITTVTVTLGR